MMQSTIDPIEVAKLDAGIKETVLFLQSQGVETFESCEGGIGHCFPEPTVRFYGDKFEGLRVTHICLQNALPIQQVRRAFAIIDNEIHQPFWEVTFKASIPDRLLKLNSESGTFTS